MESQKLANWVQIVTGVALLAGIGLVILEMQHSQRLAQAQLEAGYFDQAIDQNRAELGDNPASVLEKSCISPQELTMEERTIALAALDHRYLMGWRQSHLQETIGLNLSGEVVIREALEIILGHPIGRYDFEIHQGTRWKGQWLEIGNELLESAPDEIVDCSHYWEGFDQWLIENDYKE